MDSRNIEIQYIKLEDLAILQIIRNYEYIEKDYIEKCKINPSYYIINNYVPTINKFKRLFKTPIDIYDKYPKWKIVCNSVLIDNVSVLSLCSYLNYYNILLPNQAYKLNYMRYEYQKNMRTYQNDEGIVSHYKDNLMMQDPILHAIKNRSWDIVYYFIEKYHKYISYNRMLHLFICIELLFRSSQINLNKMAQINLKKIAQINLNNIISRIIDLMYITKLYKQEEICEYLYRLDNFLFDDQPATISILILSKELLSEYLKTRKQLGDLNTNFLIDSKYYVEINNSCFKYAYTPEIELTAAEALERLIYD